MTKPRISVVIPHYNDLAGLAACLDGLGRQTLAAEAFEIVVADNNSRCGLDEVRRVVDGRARVILAAEQGAGPARNAGVGEALADRLAFLDSDCLPAPDWLETGCRALDDAPVIGGRVDVTVVDPARPTPVEAFELVFAFHNRHYVEKLGFSITANLFVRREAFDATGPFRNGVAEDVDWCHRARSAGFPTSYRDDVAVSHPARRTWDELVRKWRRLTSEGLMLHLDKGGRLLTWWLRSLALPPSVLVDIGKILGHRRLPRFGDQIAACLVLARLRLLRFSMMQGYAVEALSSKAGAPRK